MIRSLRAVAIALLLAACGSQLHGGAPAPPADCPPRPPAGAAALDTGRVGALAGTFRVDVVWTSPSSDRGWSYRARLALSPADSAQRAASRVRQIGHWPRRDLRLVGEWRLVGDTIRYATPAEVDGGVLYVGCRDCMDASPLHLDIEAVLPTGFRGTWRDYQTGIVRLIDARTRTPLPDPAGYFCAWRLAPGDST